MKAESGALARQIGMRSDAPDVIHRAAETGDSRTVRAGLGLHIGER